MKRFDKTDYIINAVLIGAWIDVSTGALRITKTVTGAIDPTKEFLFMVSISPAIAATVTTTGGESVDFVDGIAEFTLKRGESASVDDLPDETVFIIQEADYTPEYTTTVSGDASSLDGIHWFGTIGAEEVQVVNSTGTPAVC